MTDAELVHIARRLQVLHDRAMELIAEVEEEHANGKDFAADMINQCFGIAWPEHVAHHYVDQTKWEISDDGGAYLQRKKLRGMMA